MATESHATARPIMTDASVKAKTGKTWSEWFSALDRAGAARLDHKAIVVVLGRKMKVGPWWGQMIAVSYERARGLRAKNQRRDGEFSVGVSRVIGVGLRKLFAAATAGRSAWFPKGAFEETSRTKEKYWRGKWRKNGRLEINFYAKGAGKAQIVVQSNNLSGSEAVESERAAWKKALERLQAVVEERVA